MKIKGVRERVRTKFAVPAHVVSGDTIALIDNTGPVERIVARSVITETYTFTEGVIFEADAGVFGKGRALGGAFVE